MRHHRYLILGGGMVAGYAVRELVDRGVRPGELAIISADSAPPYERPPLSKGYLAGTEDERSLAINAPGYYAAHGIDLQLNTRVTALNLRLRLVQTATGEEIGFERLLIALGARVRHLDIPGATLDGVHYLRSLDDAERLRRAASRAGRVLILGGGFIGMEAAATLRGYGLDTTLVMSGERLGERIFTPPLSRFFARVYTERGVRLASGARAVRLEGRGRVEAVVLSDGRTLPADLVVAGIGVTPATELLEHTGLDLDDGVLVNEYLESSEAGIYAAGDIARYQDVLYGVRRRVEHWDNAVEQGRHAARAMLGQRTPFVHVPYLFSDLFDLSYELWGDPAGADQVVHRGDPASGSVSVWWLRAAVPVAALVINRPEAERAFAPLAIARRAPLPVAALQNERVSLEPALA